MLGVNISPLVVDVTALFNCRALQRTLKVLYVCMETHFDNSNLVSSYTAYSKNRNHGYLEIDQHYNNLFRLGPGVVCWGAQRFDF